MIRTLLTTLWRGTDKKRLQQFKPPEIISVTSGKSLLIDPLHYKKYCKSVGWKEDSAMHPLYLQMMSLGLQMECLADKRNPIPLLGLVHRTNEVWQSAAIDAQVLTIMEAQLGKLEEHPKGWEINVIVEASQYERCVYRATARYLIRVNAPHVAKAVSSRGQQRQAFWEHYQPISEITLAGNSGRKYAQISKDFNPIHLFAISAKLFGFKRAIAHGMFTLAKSYSCLTDAKAKHDIHLEAEFLKPVLLPSTCKLMAQLGATEKNFVLVNQRQSEPHVRGTLSVDSSNR